MDLGRELKGTRAYQGAVFGEECLMSSKIDATTHDIPRFPCLELFVLMRTKVEYILPKVGP